MAACSQCGKPAVVMVGEGLPLCVDCNLKLAQAQEIRDRALKEEANYLVDQMVGSSTETGPPSITLFGPPPW
jgi:hypothetical protein